VARGSSSESPGRRVRMIFLVYCIASSKQAIKGIGSMLVLGLSHLGFDFACTRFTFLFQTGMNELSILNTLHYSLLFDMNNQYSHITKEYDSTFCVYLLTEVCFTLKLLACSSCGLGLGLGTCGLVNPGCRYQNVPLRPYRPTSVAELSRQG